MIDPLLEIGSRVTALPVVHGSGDFAWEVRRIMMSHTFDCVALPLPPSFQSTVESAILNLPVPSIVIQRDRPVYQTQWTPKEESPIEFNDDVNESDSGEDLDDDFDDDDEERELGVSFVPIDPCQPVIAAVRTAMGDRIPRRFIDMETSHYRPHSQVMPDAYALKRLPIERFAAAVLPNIEPGHNAQWRSRIRHMAWQLKELSVDFQNILFVTSILDWPWVRQAFQDRSLDCPQNEAVEDVEHHQVDHDSLYFMLGELPFITDLYETARSELEDDENLAIDGVKDLLIASRESYNEEYKSRARKITPKLLSQCLKYIRNLTLIDHRFTPQLTTIVTAAQQVAGDGYALHVLEKAKEYRCARPLVVPNSELPNLDLPKVRVSIDKIALPDGEVVSAANRLPGPPLQWCHLELVPKPDVKQQHDWKQKWNPYSQCSWPPEDDLIENFRQSVFDRAKEVMGADLAQTEKFTTSIKDGIDIRETVRHWYDNEIHIKVLPPTQGKLDAAVMLFDSPADPREYPWRTTLVRRTQKRVDFGFLCD